MPIKFSEIPGHIQGLKPDQIIARIEFCQRLLANPGCLPLIHFSDEFAFCPWWWQTMGSGLGGGEENDSATHATQKNSHTRWWFSRWSELVMEANSCSWDGTINADRYDQNLAETRIYWGARPDPRSLGLDLRTRRRSLPHITESNLTGSRKNCDVLSGRPANSPDLHPIELLWGILKHSVAAHEPQTIEQLKTSVVIQTWDMIWQTSINVLCDSFPERLKALSRDQRTVN
jgi:hypothetical protein